MTWLSGALQEAGPDWQLPQRRPQPDQAGGHAGAAHPRPGDRHRQVNLQPELSAASSHGAWLGPLLPDTQQLRGVIAQEPEEGIES